MPFGGIFIWKIIEKSQENHRKHIGRFLAIVNSGKLVWMPAHKSHLAVGVATKSDGQLLTTTDWRANRLVDCLATQRIENNKTYFRQ